MAYGTTNGVKWNMSKNTLQDLIDYDTLEEDQILAARTKADAIINAALASTVLFTDLPLTTATVSQMAMDLINSISDDLTTWFILQPVYIQKDPNKSSWVDIFYDRAMNGDPTADTGSGKSGVRGVGLNYIREQPHILTGSTFFDEIQTNTPTETDPDFTTTVIDEWDEVTRS
jgi:hypothetical protein